MKQPDWRAEMWEHELPFLCAVDGLLEEGKSFTGGVCCCHAEPEEGFRRPSHRGEIARRIT